MKLALTLLILALLPLPFPGNQPVSHLQLNDFPSSASYVVSVSNSTGNITVKHTYTLNYTLIAVNQNGEATVHIKTNAVGIALGPFNFTVAKPGNVTFNLIGTDLNLNRYPMLFPLLLLNSSYLSRIGTYSVVVSGTYVTLSGGKAVNVTVMGRNYNAYSYSGTIFYGVNSYKGTIQVLQNGLLYKLSSTVFDFPVNITLSNFSTTQILLNPAGFTFQENPSLYYIYLQKVNESPYNSLVPQGYIQLHIPLVFANGITVVEEEHILLQASGSLIAPSSNGAEVTFFVGNYSSLVTPVYPTPIPSGQIDFNGLSLNFSGTSQITTPSGSYETNVYVRTTNTTTGNITVTSKLLVYLEPNGTLVKLSTYTGDYESSELQLVSVGTFHYNFNSTSPNLTSYTNTVLPFQAVNPDLALTLSIAIPVTIIFIVLLFYRRA